MLGIPVLRPQQVETTALGAAYLAGLATGFWENPQQIQKLRGEGQRFQPNPTAAKRSSSASAGVTPSHAREAGANRETGSQSASKGKPA